MKKLLQIPLLLVALFLTSIPISAHDFSAGGIYYNITSSTNKTVEVTFRNYVGGEGAYVGRVVVPETVTYSGTTYSVTSIGYAAFYESTKLTSVVIPNSVTKIGENAFYKCTGLTSVTIPNSVTSIERRVFIDCTSLTSVTIPNSMTYISEQMFDGCIGLTSVTIPNSVTSIRSSAFWGCSGLTSVTIPNSVTSIGSSAFKDCSGLTEVNITDLSAWCKIDFEDNHANPLYYANKLKLNGSEIKNLIIPNDIAEIKDYTFYKCNGLTSVTIPEAVTSIGNNVFTDCTGLIIVNFYATNCTSMDDTYNSAFSGCTKFTTLNIGENVMSIPSYVFFDCTGLTSVTIPNSVTTIGTSAFSGCTGLTSVTIPNSVTTIGTSAFYNTPWYNNQPDGVIYINNVLYEYKGTMPAGTSIDIKDGTISISASAFKDCSGLTSVTIPNSVTTIGSSAFSGCSGLTSVTIPNSVTTIGEEAFSGCSGLTSVTIGNSVTEIGSYAFADCSGLTSVTIGNSVTEIGSYAFSGCSGLTEVTIPNSVTSIGLHAFYGCTGLTNLEVLASDIAINGSAFIRCTKLANEPVITNITQTTGIISELTSITKYSPFLMYQNQYYKNGEKMIGLTPNCTHYFNYGLKINGNYCYINDNSLSFKTSDISFSLNGTANSTSISAIGSYDIGDATLVGEGLNLNSAVTVFDNKNNVTYYNLDPKTSYSIHYGVKIKERAYAYTTSKTFTTGELNLTTQEAKPTSTTSVRLLAATNCDATEGTGFEWRRYDAPDELPSSKVSCPVVDGVLVGSLRGVKDDVYYKYRPFYTSSSGKTYYGDWIAFFTGDANVYFEPEVRTYEDIQVINNSATVKGYALEGTDVITSQGFEYWKTGSTIKPASTDDRMTVSASGISMSATLANLEYNSTYKYRAYVTTAKGTVYGDEMEFSTGEGLSGIGYIEIDSDEFVVTLRENPATGTAWVKIAGTAGEEVQYTLTSMSGAMVANGTVLLDGEWNAIDLNCSAGMYLLTINDGTQVKTLRLIVK